MSESYIFPVQFETVFEGKDPPEDERTDQLVYWCRRFDELGLAPKVSGNLSFRAERGFIITPTGVELKNVTVDSLVRVLRIEITGERVLMHAEGRAVPSKESMLHSEVYAGRAEVNAVFHTHDLMVLACAGELKLSCTEGEHDPGSPELVAEMRRLLGLGWSADCLALSKPGVVTVGKTIDQAGAVAEKLNRKALYMDRRK